MTRERLGEPGGWVLTRRYRTVDAALQAYETTRDLIVSEDIDASVFRYTLSGESFLSVLGEEPLSRVATQMIDVAIQAGEHLEIPEVVLDHLRDRRRRFKQLRVDYLERRRGPGPNKK